MPNWATRVIVPQVVHTLQELFSKNSADIFAQATIDINANTINLKVSDGELASRKAKWQPKEPSINTGDLARYASLVTSADKGAVLLAQCPVNKG